MFTIVLRMKWHILWNVHPKLHQRNKLSSPSSPFPNSRENTASYVLHSTVDMLQFRHFLVTIWEKKGLQHLRFRKRLMIKWIGKLSRIFCVHGRLLNTVEVLYNENKSMYVIEWVVWSKLVGASKLFDFMIMWDDSMIGLIEVQYLIMEEQHGFCHC